MTSWDASIAAEGRISTWDAIFAAEGRIKTWDAISFIKIFKNVASDKWIIQRGGGEELF